jgi:hypothetical protein
MFFRSVPNPENKALPCISSISSARTLESPRETPQSESSPNSGKEEETSPCASSQETENQVDMIRVGRALMSRGTQVPTLRLPYSVLQVTSSGAGLINTVFSFNFTSLSDSGSLTALFDEYRFVKAHLQYVPEFENSLGSGLSQINPRVGVGYIDYDDAAAPASYSAAWSHVDTAKAFCLNQARSFEVEFAFQPDMAWVTTATNTTPAYWKLYAEVDGVSYAYGRIFAWAELQFRAVQ